MYWGHIESRFSFDFTMFGRIGRTMPRIEIYFLSFVVVYLKNQHSKIFVRYAQALAIQRFP